MEGEIADGTKKDLLGINLLEGFERKKFLRAVFIAALKDFTFIDVPECPTKDVACLQNAVLALFTICAKHDYPIEEIQEFLTGLGIQEAAMEDILDSYKHSKEDIVKKLAKYGHDIPLFTNLNWKLSSVLRSSGTEDLQAELVYKVTLEGADEHGARSIITSFDCTIEELQNLTGKFKEIERHCQKIAGNK